MTLFIVMIILAPLCAISYGLGYVMGGRHKTERGRPEATGNLEWLDDWVRMTIPKDSFVSLEHSVINRSVMTIDLQSASEITVEPRLVRAKPIKLRQLIAEDAA